MNKICFATGNLFKWEMFKNINDIITFLKQYPFYGLEITFGHPEEIDEFSISDENKKYLKSLKYLSIHLPFKYTYQKDEATKILINKIIKIIKELNVQSVVIHPDNIIDSYYINKISAQKCIENLTPRHGFSVDDYKTFLAENKDYKIVIDTTHALHHSMDHLKELLENLKEEIYQFHWSEHDGIKKHLPVHLDHNNLKELIFPFNVPLVIEAIYSLDDIDSFNKDMKFLNRYR